MTAGPEIHSVNTTSWNFPRTQDITGCGIYNVDLYKTKARVLTTI